MKAKRMQAGMLDRIAELQVQSSARNDRNERSQKWETVKAGIHCHVDPQGGLENDSEANRQPAFGRIQLIVRYLPVATPSMRMVVEGRIYNIKAVFEMPGTRRQWTVLDCQTHD